MEALFVIITFGFYGENYEVPFAYQSFRRDTSYQSLEECNEGILSIVKELTQLSFEKFGVLDPVIRLDGDHYVASYSSISKEAYLADAKNKVGYTCIEVKDAN